MLLHKLYKVAHLVSNKPTDLAVRKTPVGRSIIVQRRRCNAEDFGSFFSVNPVVLIENLLDRQRLYYPAPVIASSIRANRSIISDTLVSK